MSRRKPNSAHARMVRYSRAMLRSNHIAVLDIEATELHTIINWQNGTLIATKSRRALVDCLCDIPHRWTIYLAALLRIKPGDTYIKSEELVIDGNYMAATLEDVIEPRAEALRATCNPAHFVSLAWLAIPYEATLTEAHAAKLFEAFGAWQTTEAA